MATDRDVVDLSVEPPEVVVLDTSAIAVAPLEDHPTHAEYNDFLIRAVGAGTTRAYCELVELELAQVCSKRARQRFGGDRARSFRRGER